MKPSLAIFGNLTIDDLVFADGTTRWGVPGGGAVYAAFGARVWTSPVSIVAPVGADYPMALLNEFFDMSRCSQISQTLRNWGLYEEDGTRHFVSRSAARDWSAFSPRPDDAATGHQTAAHLAPMPHNVAVELSRELRKGGQVTISLDLDDHDFAKKASLEAIVELLRRVDLFIPSLQDARTLFGGTEVHEVLRRIRSVAPEVALVAVKCGPDGVTGHGQGASKYIHVPAVPVDLVDVTGAGDAFCGGALASFANTGDPFDALLAGAVSASFCVESLGLAGLVAVTREEAEGRLSTLRRHAEFQPA